jgi:hypothetical protein
VLNRFWGYRLFSLFSEFEEPVFISWCALAANGRDRMLAACCRRLIDSVVVYRYDRFARSLRQLVNALCEFDSLGVQFISLHEVLTPRRQTAGWYLASSHQSLSSSVS